MSEAWIGFCGVLIGAFVDIAKGGVKREAYRATACFEHESRWSASLPDPAIVKPASRRCTEGCWLWLR